MKFGAFLWQRRGEDLAANARLAEQLGFESVWMGEHLGFPIQFKSPYPYDESGIPPVRNDAAIHDPLIVLPILLPSRLLSSLEPGFIYYRCATRSRSQRRSPASISSRMDASFSELGSDGSKRNSSGLVWTGITVRGAIMKCSN
jgi:hypothetical protein